MIPRVLTIAGSDSGGGAGIQADLKTITVLGGFGMSAITAITAQNTVAVGGIHELPLDMISLQIQMVIEDIGVDAVKTGMLLSSRIVRLVAEKVRELQVPNLVVDPVMVAKSGDELLLREAQKALKESLVPLSTVVTPNIPEAEILSERTISTVEDMKEAARVIHGLGARNVVIKGGHRQENPMDLLFDGRDFLSFEGKRFDTPNTHGTGCTFSAAVATGLGQGLSVEEAVGLAKRYIQEAIRYALDIGEGHGPTNHFAPVLREREESGVLDALAAAGMALEEMRVGDVIPEVQSNLVFALPQAEDPEDVAGFPGRIVRYYDSAATLSSPEFGASRHVAGVVVRIMSKFPDHRAAMNIRADQRVLETAARQGLRAERADVRHKDTGERALQWDTLLGRLDEAPDLLYHEGGFALEPQALVLGVDPHDVVAKISKLLRIET